jgi:hypothetical protein
LEDPGKAGKGRRGGALRRTSEIPGEDYLWCLEGELPPYALRHLEEAFAGDEQAAAALCFAAPNEHRGYIAAAAYGLGVPNPAYQTIIRQIWNHDHQQLLWAVDRDADLVRRMMADAEFRHPFSGPVTVYRGVEHGDFRKASRGLSWTVSRDVACWFAHDLPNSLVLVGKVSSADIVFWDNSRNEEEVVFRSPIRASIDLERSTWAEAADRHLRKIRIA